LASKESMMRSVDVGVTGRTPVLIVLAAFAAATVYEVLVAVNEIHLGELPGEGPPGPSPSVSSLLRQLPPLLLSR
jgi:hypothetical protein